MSIPVRLIRRCSVVALCVGALPFVACSSSSEPTSAVQSESASKSESTHSRGRSLDEIIKGLDLRPEQQTEVDKLRAEAKERHAPIKAAKRELMIAVADQIEKKGEADRCELAPRVDKIASAVAKVHPADRAAFERFHAILDPQQRGKFVDAMRQRFQEKEKAHDKEEMAEAISEKLDLSDDQEERLEKIVGALREIREADPSREEHLQRMNKILDAFKGDTFKLDEIAPVTEKDVEQAVKQKLERRAWAGEAILPVLDVEQRGKLAKILRAKSEAREGSGAASGSSSKKAEADEGGMARDELPSMED